MKDILRSSLLYDFYGELLTKHQQEIYEEVVLNDYSLGEIAEERNISRQGVHDLIKRCDKTLNEYEEKLHLVSRFEKTKEQVERICQLADENNMQDIENIGEIENAEKAEKPKPIGQVFDTYVLCTQGDSFWMIDQHAAHERARFEKLKADYYSKERMSQVLMSPIILKLDYNEVQTVLSNLNEYKKFGFDIEDFGSGSIIINATPIISAESEIRDLVLEIAAALENTGRHSVAEFEESLLDMIACKYAIKANRHLNYAEMQEVIDIVIRLAESGITTCPHGRPIKIELTKTEIEKMFKRRV